MVQSSEDLFGINFCWVCKVENIESDGISPGLSNLGAFLWDSGIKGK